MHKIKKSAVSNNNKSMDRSDLETRLNNTLSLQIQISSECDQGLKSQIISTVLGIWQGLKVYNH